MSKAALVIAKMPGSCAECVALYGRAGFCSCGGLYENLAGFSPIFERAPFCPLIELPGEIKPEDCEVLEIDTDKRFTEDEKELIACGTAHGWNCLLDILTEGRGSNDK